ncbi:MAG: 50S ribosomal protein L33 [Candidatus Pacebacteria bacterium]|nr:50S ribosomal protein L33 [Candidatus Paceibacterota bacterium]
MAESKITPNLIKFRCETCKRINYYSHKNKKKVERKLEYKKYCSWCRKHTKHKEGKK